MILMIDNYDSFTYNLVHYLEGITDRVSVKRNDALTIAEIEQLKPSVIVISPGPKTPDDAGISLAVIARFSGHIPILGICLGHQAIAQYYGATVVRAPQPVHGKLSAITHDGEGLFSGIPQGINVTRYHSLVVDEASLPASLRVTARTDDGLIMGLRHQSLPIESVQFHPEALLTERGRQMLKNVIDDWSAHHDN